MRTRSVTPTLRHPVSMHDVDLQKLGVVWGRGYATATLQCDNMMATIFDLPVYDVLFARIFCYLDAWEIWRIKTVSARFNRICWKYFKCFLLELNVDLSTFEIGKDATAKLAAAKVIARISSQLKMFTLHLPLSVIHLLGQRNDVETLFTVIAHASPQLSRLCIINLDSLPFGLTTAKHLGLCCGQLTELVLCNINPTDIDFDILLLSILDHQINAMTKLTLSTVKLCRQDTLRKSAFKTPNLKSLTVRFYLYPIHCLQYTRFIV